MSWDAKAGRDSENNVPFVATVSVDNEGHLSRGKLAPVPGFTNEAIIEWSKGHLTHSRTVHSDGLACIGGVSVISCFHFPIVVGERKPDDLPNLR